MSEQRTLVLLRHGQTAWNAVRRIQGQLDVEIDEVGHAQARAVAPVIAKLGPTAVWASDLARARRTAEYVADHAGLTVRPDPRLREFLLGERQGWTHAEYAAADPVGFARFADGDWADVPGGEPPATVAERYAEALTDLAGSLGPGETGVAVSHGAATRIGLVAFLGWPLRAAADLRHLGNCAWAVLTERVPGHWALAAYNRTA